MRNLKRLGLKSMIAGLLLLSSSTVFAGDFKLCNKSNSQNLIVFQVENAQKRNAYSNNWLRAPIANGYCRDLSFSSRNHSCEIRYKAIFSDGKVSKGVTDVCNNRLINAYR